MLLIDHFGRVGIHIFKRQEEITIVLFICYQNVIETTRTNDPTEVCANQLKSECQGWTLV